MPDVAKIIGGAGTGKTTHLLKLMEWWLHRDFMTPQSIGFVSFTRAARSEAATRAADKFHLDIKELEQDGWFRTIHSACCKLLGSHKGSVISDSKKDREWLRNALGEDVSGPGAASSDGSEPISQDDIQGKKEADIALALWDAARNRLCPLKDVWDRAYKCDERTPAYGYCKALVEKYEQHKRLDNRTDYSDVLGLYAGVSFNVGGHSPCNPVGEIPHVSVWFLDEWQDASALLDKVAKRLTSNAEWVYLVADPFQAIYNFAGSDSRYFNEWEVTQGHQRVLPQTFRCPAPVFYFGERILSDCSDYWDRQIQPAPHSGELEEELYNQPWPELIDPKGETTWLLLARTNFLASRLAKRIDATGIPWHSVKGFGSRWHAPQKIEAITGLLSLERGSPISASEWLSILKQLPAKIGEQEIFTRGTKASWENNIGGGVQDTHELNDLEHMPQWGAAAGFLELVSSKKWRARLDLASDFIRAWDAWGPQSVLKPRVRVGTIHATKGMEADNVVLLTTTSHQIQRGCEDQQGWDEEQRVWYVGATRARKRLLVTRESDAKYKWEAPA